MSADAGFTIWLTGLSGTGKSTVAGALAAKLERRGRRTEVLDGDVVRSVLSPDLGYSRADRDANVRRIGWICELLSRHGVVAIAAVISPYRDVRAEVRDRIGRFVEVHMDAPWDVLAARDPKGLYRRAEAGELTGFSGRDDPYEAPIDPDVRCVSDGRETPDESADRILAVAEAHGYLARDRE